MSTLSDLDEKTKAMLKLIEEDADSFAQRAEMYYKKRPELVTMVEDFYRAHRSLAEQYDQLKLESGTRRMTPPDCLSSTKSSSSISEESEVNDPEQEEEIAKEEVSNEIDVSELVKLGKDLEILKEKNKVMKAELMDKDEEKREVIRQLSMALEILKEENICLKQCIKDSTKKKGLFEFNAKWKKRMDDLNISKESSISKSFKRVHYLGKTRSKYTSPIGISAWDQPLLQAR
ncbi:hypothetical protein QJS10_CPA05g00537 [Acorus calamus]|uniref:NAB domain-containing protein n=1 Tax=Acorus calamus TaxID=4465 RepID=A0AAV9ERK2_ACOCL|nr:hypothetical protein QJS10_CPA05g00537 [Acorus calamus]